MDDSRAEDSLDGQGYPPALKEHFLAISEAREVVLRELERMTEAKQQYERAVEIFLDFLEEQPQGYRRRTTRGKKVVSEELTLEELQAVRRAFRKNIVEQSAARFFLDWNDCPCPERSWCVRLNCEPGTFNTCCYLCVSTDPLQCIGDFP